MSEAFLCHPVRTPFGRFAGKLAAVRADDLAAVPLSALRTKLPRVDWEVVDDVIWGAANQAGEDNRNAARMAWLLAGMPESVSGVTVNRLCGSGMESVVQAARMVRLGEASLVVAGGSESMSRAPFVVPKAEAAFSRASKMYDTTLGWRFVNPKLEQAFGVDSMPETAENVASEYCISREDQDRFALRSQLRAKIAQEEGRLAEEIEPVILPLPKRGEPQRVSVDEHLRPDTTYDKLAGLPTPFRSPGTVTAGNASGVNDGAAAVLIASEAMVQKFGLEPVARVCGAATAGVPPRIMGMGPFPATQKLLQRSELRLSDVGVIELNEAFAAQSIAVLRKLGLPDDAEHVNPNGGAIALGHPLGASGTRIVMAAGLELRRRRAETAVATMCIGVGQGISVLLRSP